MTEPQRFRKKPVEVEAMRLDAGVSSNPDEFSPNSLAQANIAGWMLSHGFRGFRVDGNQRPFGMIIETLEGEMYAAPGDWIIRGVNGEFYPCKPDVFQQTYELASTSSTDGPDEKQTYRDLTAAVHAHARAAWDGDLVIDWVLVAGLSDPAGSPSVGTVTSRANLPRYVATGLLHEALRLDAD